MQAVNSCVPCRQGKRRCDRDWPACYTCSRIGRTCTYDTSALRPANSETVELPSSILAGPENLSEHSPQSTAGPTTSISARSSLIDFTVGVDPFRHDSLRRPTVDVIVQEQLLKVIGSRNYMHEVASEYFATISRRISIVSAERFFGRLPSIESTKCAADFTALCLCIYLVSQVPRPHDRSMQSSLYVTSKSIISLLEATSYHSLEVVQCCLLIAFYEMGHGIYPAAAASIGACAKMAHYASSHHSSILSSKKDEREIVVEEKRRTLWALHNLDRYLNLSLGGSLFTTPFAQEKDALPVEERQWSQNIAPGLVTHTLDTPADVTIGTFARECQIFHIVGRVLRNVYEPVVDEAFQAKEAEQLEMVMSAFIPLLQQDKGNFVEYCISFAVCSSALFTLYGSSIGKGKDNVRRAALIERTSVEITDYCRKLFGIEEQIHYGTLSPFLPYALYQAAVVQQQILKHNPETRYERNVQFLKQVLGSFNKRWLVAGKYLLELQKSSPPLLYNII